MFTKAARKGSHLKLAITGPSGSGKTYSALRLAAGISDNGRIALIDTENQSASLYANDFAFDVVNVEPPFTIDKLTNPTVAALEEDYDVLIIDSASHFWNGVLEYKSQLDKRGGNSYTNWNEANKNYDLMLRAILFSKIHVIVCMRSKMEYILEENDRGKQVPRKVGMAPIMRDGVEYEFTTVFDLDMAHQAQTSKDRTKLFGEKIFQITEETGSQLEKWLNKPVTKKPRKRVKRTVLATSSNGAG
ncbi:MAG: ATP-binding protein [Balneola sp.]